MLASAEMSWYVEGVIIKQFNVLNHIRWADKESMAKESDKEQLRRYVNNSEEIIFAEQFGMDTEQQESMIYKPVVEYLNNAIIKTNMTVNKCNQVLGKIGIASHQFKNFQHRPITEDAYNKLRKHMET